MRFLAFGSLCSTVGTWRKQSHYLFQRFPQGPKSQMKIPEIKHRLPAGLWLQWVLVLLLNRESEREREMLKQFSCSKIMSKCLCGFWFDHSDSLQREKLITIQAGDSKYLLFSLCCPFSVHLYYSLFLAFYHLPSSSRVWLISW